jgi:YHS domain-containing protein
MVSGGTALQAHALIFFPAPSEPCPQLSKTAPPEFSLKAAARGTQVLLRWAPATSEPLEIYEGTAPDICGAGQVSICTVTSGSALAAGLASGTTYYFWLVDTKSNVVSNMAQATTPTAGAPAAQAAAPGNGQVTLFEAAPPSPFGDCVPGPPAGLSAAPGNGQVTLSWTAPASDDGSPVTGYNVYQGTSPGGETGTPVNGSPVTATSDTVTGLTNGTTYYFTVVAVSAAGPSPPSNEASAVPVTVPGAPAGLSAAPGNGQVTLSWTAPASDDGSPVTGYNVYQGTSPGGETGTPVNGSPVTATSDTVTGLTNGTTYYFTVTAVNQVGEGPGAEVKAVPVTVPGAPAGLSAAPGNGQVTLSWAAPASDGGSPVSGYDLYVGTTADFSGGAPLATVTGTAVAVTGLVNGTAYYFTVTAVNQVGEGPGAEVKAVPVTVPGAPAGLSAAPGNGQVSLSWAAPASDGGSPVTGYIIYQGSRPGGETGTPVNGSPVTATSDTVTGLTSGTTYYFTVVAVNAAGLSPPSEEASATLPPIVSTTGPPTTGPPTTGPPTTGPPTTGPPTTGPPFAAPTRLTATAGNTQVRLSWTAPASDGGSSVTGYKVYVATVPGVQGAVASGSIRGTDATVTGLADDTVYYFMVSAVNATGNESPLSTEVSAEPVAARVLSVRLPSPTAPTQLIALLAVVAAMAAAGVFTLISRRRRIRSPVRSGQQMAVAPDLRVVPDTSRPDVLGVRDTGPEPTHTVRLEPRPGPTTTTIKERRP